MDPILAAVVSAVTTTIGNRIATDVYDVLKARLRKIFGKNIDPLKPYFIFAKHSEKCLDATWNTEDGAAIHQWTYHGGDIQKWKIIPVDEEYVFILSEYSRKCIDVAGPEAQDGTIVHQWHFHGGANQLWKFTPAGDGFYYIMSKLGNMCLDATWNTDDGARVHLWSFHGQDNQKWAVVPKPE